ncbi:MAG: squalene/phytoene synthase family protein [Phycisphaerales bacterium]|nr:squalene/phytoene synthase family protein [Planctomycetota bacterium]MCH8507309.1 squalene/phytoene synthase family protein [Phycisphaerales bacterium]
MARDLPIPPPSSDHASPDAGVSAARADARRIASSDRENFVVLSKLVPENLRDDFAAVYAFCRHTDDLADEHEHTEKSRREAAATLADARVHLHAACDNLKAPGLYLNLARTIHKHRIPLKLFDDLLNAFEQDQRVLSYDTWDRLLDYCRRSADPVGRIVLILGGHRPSAEDPASAPLEALSDKVCTGLQLANFWQDARSDLLDRHRVYMPTEDTRLTPDQLRGLAEREGNTDAEVRFSSALRPLVRRTRTLFDEAGNLHEQVHPSIAAPVWLFHRAGIRLLDKVESIGYTTLWQRPRITKADRVKMLAKAWWIARKAGA